MSLRLIMLAVVGVTVLVTVDPVPAQPPPKPGMMSRVKSWFRNPFSKKDDAYTSITETDQGFRRTRISKTPSTYAPPPGGRDMHGGYPTNRMQSSIQPGNGPLPRTQHPYRDADGNLRSLSSSSSASDRSYGERSRPSQAEAFRSDRLAMTPATSRPLPRSSHYGRDMNGTSRMRSEDRGGIPTIPRESEHRRGEDAYVRGDDRGAWDQGMSSRSTAFDRAAGRYARSSRDEERDQRPLPHETRYDRGHGNDEWPASPQTAGRTGFSRQPDDEDAGGRFVPGEETANPFERSMARNAAFDADVAPPQRAVIPERQAAGYDIPNRAESAEMPYRQAGYARPEPPQRRATGFDYPPSDIGEATPAARYADGRSTYFGREDRPSESSPPSGDREAAFDRSFNSRRTSFDERRPTDEADWAREEAARYRRMSEDSNRGY